MCAFISIVSVCIHYIVCTNFYLFFQLFLALMAVGELAKGVVYKHSIKTGYTCKHRCNLCCVIFLPYCRWRPPRCILKRSAQQHEEVRQKWHILTEGEDPPPPIKTFKVIRCVVYHTICMSHTGDEIPSAITGCFEEEGHHSPHPNTNTRNSSSV